MNEQLMALLYKRAVEQYPVPRRLRPVIRRIQLASDSEATYMTRIQALMAEEPELASIFALRSALVESAAAHLAAGDLYDAETDSWRGPLSGPQETP